MIGWQQKTLGQIIELQRGHDLPEPDRRPGSIPVVGSAGPNGWHDTAKAPGPGVTIGRSGASAGVVTFVQEPYWPHNTVLYVKDFKGNDPRFIAYLLTTLPLAELNSGAAQPSLNRNFLYPVPVRVPSLSIQHRIASILGAYDDLIEVNRRRTALLEEMARRLFEEWFVNFHFPGHEDHAMVETPDGPLPSGWHRVRLDEVANVNDNTIKPANAPDRIGYIDIASVMRGEIQQIEWQAFADAPGRARRKVRDGSIIWSTVRPNRRSYALIMNPEDHLIVSTGFAVLDPHRTSAAYLFHYVTTDDFVGYLVGNTTGAAYPAVTGATFERALVLLPIEELDQKFNAVAEPMLRTVDTLRRQNIRLALSRDLLLPRLISGELSVSTVERELEAVA